ncbi:Uncharacterised protein [Mycobacterium tuberculosis]|nr:Uncharacterised protein [Mycobacterium tuberculosis]
MPSRASAVPRVILAACEKASSRSGSLTIGVSSFTTSDQRSAR